jgi:hypothetical protein
VLALLLIAALAAGCTAAPAAATLPTASVTAPSILPAATDSPHPSAPLSPDPSAVLSPTSMLNGQVTRTAVDLGNETHFGVVADTQHPFFGRFGFAKYGIGVFWASGATVTPAADGSIHVVYQGQGWSDPDAKVEIFVGMHKYSDVRLPVELDLDMHVADQPTAAEYGRGRGRLIADGVTYLVGTDGPVPSPDPTVDELLVLIRTEDWRGLHATLVSQFRTAISAAAFESEMRLGLAKAGRLVEVGTAGPITTYDNMAGPAAFVVLEFAIDTDGHIITYPSRVDLVYGDERWQVFNMEQVVTPEEPAR